METPPRTKKRRIEREVKRVLQTVQQCEVCPINGRISNLESPSGPMQVQYVDVPVNSVQDGEEHVVNNLLASDNFLAQQTSSNFNNTCTSNKKEALRK
jgi:hypothetical protein